MPIAFQLERYLNPVFVETGTFRGDGVDKALQAGFKKIFSIELDKANHDFCAARFNKEIASGRVVLIQGDSCERLWEVIGGMSCSITFWLDAHYCGAGTAKAPKEVPLLEEIDIIARHRYNNHTILIDDINFFQSGSSDAWRVISVQNVIERLMRINGRYRISYENGYCADSVLAASPARGNLYGRIIRNFLRT